MYSIVNNIKMRKNGLGTRVRDFSMVEIQVHCQHPKNNPENGEWSNSNWHIHNRQNYEGLYLRTLL